MVPRVMREDRKPRWDWSEGYADIAGMRLQVFEMRAWPAAARFTGYTAGDSTGVSRSARAGFSPFRGCLPAGQVLTILDRQ